MKLGVDHMSAYLDYQIIIAKRRWKRDVMVAQFAYRFSHQFHVNALFAFEIEQQWNERKQAMQELQQYIEAWREHRHDANYDERTEAAWRGVY